MICLPFCRHLKTGSQCLKVKYLFTYLTNNILILGIKVDFTVKNIAKNFKNLDKKRMVARFGKVNLEAAWNSL
jgi:hypothetical protein